MIRPRRARTLAGLTGVGLAIAFAFATPASLRLARGLLAPNEARLGEAIVAAFGGVGFPILGGALAAAAVMRGAPLRVHADRLVAAGAEPARTITRPALAAIGAAAIAAVLAGIVTVALLRIVLHLPAAMVEDLFGTAWANALGATTWTAIGLACVAPSGRPSRGAIPLALDLVTRILPGAAAWIAPSAHVGNLLGAPPSRGVVAVPVLPQPASAAALIAIAVVAAAIAIRRYVGAAR